MTDFNVIRQYIQDKRLDESLSLLRSTSSNNSLEYVQLISLCKKTLSEQYLFNIILLLQYILVLLWLIFKAYTIILL